jgi:hypothetical protein
MRTRTRTGCDPATFFCFPVNLFFCGSVAWFRVLPIRFASSTHQLELVRLFAAALPLRFPLSLVSTPVFRLM